MLSDDQFIHDPEQIVLSFPQKLYTILEDENTSILRWSENGYCFRILDYEKFIDTILPKYFNRKSILLFFHLSPVFLNSMIFLSLLLLPR